MMKIPLDASVTIRIPQAVKDRYGFTAFLEGVPDTVLYRQVLDGIRPAVTSLPPGWVARDPDAPQPAGVPAQPKEPK